MADYAYVWEFPVAAEREAEFLRHYAHGGSWEALFQRAPGYRGTLLHDRESPRRYLTLDRWESAEAYQAFRRDFAREYAELDRRCEGLTEVQTPLGSYDE